MKYPSIKTSLLSIHLTYASCAFAGITNVSVPETGIMHESLTIAVDILTHNDVYDPSSTSLFAMVTDPLGQTQMVNGYFYEDFDVVSDPTTCESINYRNLRPANVNCEVYVPTNQSNWFIKYTPQLEGTYQVKVYFQDGNTVSFLPIGGTYAIAVAASTLDGFIVKRNDQFLKRTNDPFLFPIGQNLPGYGSSMLYDIQFDPVPGDQNFPHTGVLDPVDTKGVNEMMEYIDQISANGGNLIRVNMNSSMSLVGYDLQTMEAYGCKYNQKDAHQMDRVLDYARSKGVNVLFVMFEHAYFGNDDYAYNSWDYWNYFNSQAEMIDQGCAQGCPATSPFGIFDIQDECTMNKFKNLVRYMVARYSHHTNILAWELWNEVESIKNVNLGIAFDDATFQTQVKEWHDYMANYIREIDPYDHLITTSHINTHPEVFESLDLSINHDYKGTCEADASCSPAAPQWCDFVHHIQIETDQARTTHPTKPHFWGEWGTPVSSCTECDAVMPGYPYLSFEGDRGGLELHSNLWGSMFTGGCATALPWANDVMDKHDMYNEYKPIASFAASMPPLPGDMHGAYILDDEDPLNFKPEAVYNGLRVALMSNTSTSITMGYAQDISMMLSHLLSAQDGSHMYLASGNVNYRPSNSSSINDMDVSAYFPDGTSFRVRWYDPNDPNCSFDVPVKDEVIQVSNGGAIYFAMPQELRDGKYADGVFVINNVDVKLEDIGNEDPKSLAVEQSENVFSVWPNPSSDRVNISYAVTDIGQVIVSIFGSDGRELQHTVLGSRQQGTYQEVVSMAGLAPGVYVLTLQQGTTVHRKTVVKN